MNQTKIFVPVFLVTLLLGAIGVLLKIFHLPGATVLVPITIILTAVYVVAALYEIYGSKRVSLNEKLIWTVGFIFFGFIAGILYYFVGRPRIFREYKVL